MLNKLVRLPQLQALLSSRLGSEWYSLETETIMAELGFPDYLVFEKVNVLKVLSKDVNQALSDPLLVSLLCSVTNNEYCEFEVFMIPNALELAWALMEAKKVAVLSGQKFTPSEELKSIVGYMLREEGFSEAIPPFDFLPPDSLSAGQTPEDTRMKAQAISAYAAHMEQLASEIIVETEEYPEMQRVHYE